MPTATSVFGAAAKEHDDVVQQELTAEQNGLASDLHTAITEERPLDESLHLVREIRRIIKPVLTGVRVSDGRDGLSRFEPLALTAGSSNGNGNAPSHDGIDDETQAYANDIAAKLGVDTKTALQAVHALIMGLPDEKNMANATLLTWGRVKPGDLEIDPRTKRLKLEGDVDSLSRQLAAAQTERDQARGQVADATSKQTDAEQARDAAVQERDDAQQQLSDAKQVGSDEALARIKKAVQKPRVGTPRIIVANLDDDDAKALGLKKEAKKS